jgi:hypothetical protein
MSFAGEAVPVPIKPCPIARVTLPKRGNAMGASGCTIWVVGWVLARQRRWRRRSTSVAVIFAGLAIIVATFSVEPSGVSQCRHCACHQCHGDNAPKKKHSEAQLWVFVVAPALRCPDPRPATQSRFDNMADPADQMAACETSTTNAPVAAAATRGIHCVCEPAL